MSHDPACVGHDPQLFDSTHPFDHLRARRVCGGCPMVQACIGRAVAEAGRYRTHYRGPDGTWGGLLWRGGSVVDVRRLIEREDAA